MVELREGKGRETVATILEALTAKFDGDFEKAFRALAMLTAVMEQYGENGDWDEGYREIYNALLGALREEYRR